MELLQLESNLSSALINICKALDEIDHSGEFETEETKKAFIDHKELKAKLDHSITSAKKANEIFNTQLKNKLKLFASKDKLQSLSNDQTNNYKCSLM